MENLEKILNSNSISNIAKFIKQDWKNISYGAEPYLNAMLYLENINDYYFEDSAKSIITYFLANASTYRGNNARQIKQYLKNL